MILLTPKHTSVDLEELSVIESDILSRELHPIAADEKATIRKIEKLLNILYDTVSKALKRVENHSVPDNQVHELHYTLRMAELVLQIVEHSYDYQNPEMTDVIHAKLRKLKKAMVDME